MSDTLVPEPQASIFDSVTKALGNDEDAARRVMLNPNLAKGFKDGKPVNKESKKDGQDTCGCGNHADACGCSQPQDDDIPLKAVDDIGRATAADVKEALHQVIDPELGIDVIDLGLVYGIEIDELGRAIITMTLTTPACPLTDLIEDECASTSPVSSKNFASTGPGTLVGRWTRSRRKAVTSSPRSASISTICRNTDVCCGCRAVNRGRQT